jgi:hypothetical protein
MSRAVFQRRFAALGLLAMLALALLPTIGRLASPTGAAHEVAANETTIAAENAALGAMCTVTGLRYDDTAALALAEALAPEAPPKAPTPHEHADCDYCPLAASTALPLVAALPATTPSTHVALPARISAPFPRRHPSGLGSRGPPA